MLPEIIVRLLGIFLPWPMSNISIVGAGKVGTVLGRILVENGEKIVCIVSRTKKSAQSAGRFLHCRNVSDSLDAIPATTDLIYITTPHAAVEDVATNLSKFKHLDFKRLSVCHASGMLTARALEPLRKRGAAVFSFHPLQTFPRDFAPKDIAPTARGIYFAVDGTPQAIKQAKSFARKLEGRVMVIRPELRVFYHAACVVASNHLTGLLSVLESMFGRLGSGEKDFFAVFQPIIFSTLRNVKLTSPMAALSGPVARGGVETVADHFASIKAVAPQLLPYFGTLTLETVKLAERKGSLTKDRALALRNLVHSYTGS
jgi:predicted short-subunit dehydrogenase-like oxidoreductase (DUF2520 family)